MNNPECIAFFAGKVLTDKGVQQEHKGVAHEIKQQTGANPKIRIPGQIMMLFFFEKHIKKVKTHGGKQHTFQYPGNTVKLVNAYQEKGIIERKNTKGINRVTDDPFCRLFYQQTEEEGDEAILNDCVNMKSIEVIDT